RSIPHSSETLTSPKMLALVEQFKRRYPNRVVLFDLPPLLGAADVLAFAPYTDATLLVVEEGRTSLENVQRALQLLKGATPVIGTVLNKSQHKMETGVKSRDAGADSGRPGKSGKALSLQGRGNK